MAMPATPPAAGHGRVVLDTPGTPSSVARLTGTSTGTTPGGTVLTMDTEKTVCAATPCVADMKLGSQTLVFTSKADPTTSENVDVTVGDSPLVVRHVYSELHTSTVNSVGAGLLLGGVTIVPPGAIMTAAGAVGKEHTIETVGLSLAITGGALILIGLVMDLASQSTLRPGATTQWTEAGAGVAP